LDSTSQLTGLQYEAYLVMDSSKSKLKLISPYLENTDILEAFKTACNDVLYDQVSSKKRAKTLLKEMKEILADK
jgi:hypothetical protein